MKAFEAAPAGQMPRWRCVDRARPQVGRGQVLVRLRAASLNYRDLLFSDGRHGFPIAPPGRIPLSDGAGEVVEVGPEVDRVAPGDRVAGLFAQTWFGGSHSREGRENTLAGALDGVLSEYRAFDQHGLVKLPRHLSFDEGATLPCAALTAWNALYGLTLLRSGQTVLALGTGGVSLFAVQFAKAAGARVIVTSSSDAKLDRARALGADDVINYARQPDWSAEVLRLTGGQGVDQVIEVGGAGTLPQSIRCAASGGIVSIIGMLAGGETIDPMSILAANCVLRGVLVGSREMFQAMNRTIEVHRIRPAIDRLFEFEQANEALAYLDTGAHVGKIVIRIGGGEA